MVSALPFSFFALASAKTVILATFDGTKETTLTWKPVNDPVMGGQSTSTFSVEAPKGIFQGEVKVVPSLGAPGFCNLETTGKVSLPDVSDTDGIVVAAKQTLDGGLKNFDVRLSTTQTNAAKPGASWGADFEVADGVDSYFVPYSAFTCQWRGQTLKTCGNIAEQLSSVTQLVVGSGGVAGPFRLELTSFAAATKAEAFSVGALAKLPNIVELAQSVDDLSTLVAAVVAGDLVDTLSSPGPFTVFAPTNEAFAALPDGTLDSLLKPENKEQLVDVLTYHVVGAKAMSWDLTDNQLVTTVEGKNLVVQLTVKDVLINTAKVVNADVEASNGVVHVVDQVLLPSAAPGGTIVEAAVATESLSTLVAAVTAGGLVDTLSSAGPFTVFAPTNDAFSALPDGTLDTLLKPENKGQLVDILTYHVVGVKALSRTLMVGDVETIEGKSVTINLEKGVMINTANVVLADVLTTNGVVHVVDAVLLPPSSVVV